MLNYFIIFLLCFLLAAIIMLFIKFIRPYLDTSSKNTNSTKTKKAKNNISHKKNNNRAEIIPKNPGYQRCPICNSILEPGQHLQSRVFKTGNTDELCHIIGCPHCFPKTEIGVKRICPVCRKIIPSNGHLIARIFHKQNKNDHVHIVGCTECHSR